MKLASATVAQPQSVPAPVHGWNTRDALDAMDPVDAVLLDINMPGMNGYQVLEIFKADATLKNIPVVAVTANAMHRDIERGKAAGFDDYLTKPLNIRNFSETVDHYLTGRKPNTA